MEKAVNMNGFKGFVIISLCHFQHIEQIIILLVVGGQKSSGYLLVKILLIKITWYKQVLTNFTNLVEVRMQASTYCKWNTGIPLFVWSWNLAGVLEKCCFKICWVNTSCWLHRGESVSVEFC